MKNEELVKLITSTVIENLKEVIKSTIKEEYGALSHKQEISRKAKIIEKSKSPLIVKTVSFIKKRNGKKRKFFKKFVKVRLLINKSLFVTGLIKNDLGKVRKIHPITLGPGNSAWVFYDDYKNCIDLEPIGKDVKVNKYLDDKMQPPISKFGEYIKHTSIYGEGTMVSDEYKIHPAVVDEELGRIITEKKNLHSED